MYQRAGERGGDTEEVNTRLDDRLDKATESALGRFVYRFLLPGLVVLVGWLGTRSIASLDNSLSQVQTSTQAQSIAQAQMQNDVQAIRAQMDYQTKYQTLVDAQQNEKLEQHDRALHLK